MKESLAIAWKRLSARKLRKFDDSEYGWIGGVCAGVGYWLGVPVWIVRLAWTCSFFLYGVGFIPYTLLWIFLPKWEEAPDDFKQITGD